MDIYHELYLKLAPKNVQFPRELRISVIFFYYLLFFNLDLFRTGSLIRQGVLNHHYPKSEHST